MLKHGRPLLLMILSLVLAGCGSAELASRAATGQTSEARLPPGTLALTPEMEQRAGIKFAPVARRSLASTGTFSTTIEAPLDRSGVVASPVAGIVARVLVDVGESVRRGQVVGYVSAPEIAELQAAYLSAVARVQEARSQVQLAAGRAQLARAELDRETALYQKGISSQREQQAAAARYNSVLSEVAAARSTEAAAKAAQAAARTRLAALHLPTGGSISDTLPLVSPVSGVVVARTVQPGQTVMPVAASSAAGEGPLLTIADLSQVWAVLEVPQSEVSQLKLGAPVRFISDAVPGETFAGRVVRLGENFDPQARTAQVRVAIANPRGSLKPGMLVLSQALDRSPTPVLVVPAAAVQQVEGKDVVFVRTGPQRYRLQPVALGRRTGDYAEVLSGVIPGAEVVTDGSFVLKSESLKASLEE